MQCLPIVGATLLVVTYTHILHCLKPRFNVQCQISQPYIDYKLSNLSIYDQRMFELRQILCMTHIPKNPVVKLHKTDRIMSPHRTTKKKKKKKKKTNKRLTHRSLISRSSSSTPYGIVVHGVFKNALEVYFYHFNVMFHYILIRVFFFQ